MCCMVCYDVKCVVWCIKKKLDVLSGVLQDASAVTDDMGTAV